MNNNNNNNNNNKEQEKVRLLQAKQWASCAQ